MSDTRTIVIQKIVMSISGGGGGQKLFEVNCKTFKNCFYFINFL